MTEAQENFAAAVLRYSPKYQGLLPGRRPRRPALCDALACVIALAALIEALFA